MKPNFVLRLTGHTTHEEYGDFDSFSALERKKTEVERSNPGKETHWKIEMVELNFDRRTTDPLTEAMIREEADKFLDTAFR